MQADEREGARVVEPAALEARVGRSVARLAGRRDSRRRVVRAGGPLVVRQVAADAVARGALVDAVLVAARARLRRMQADEREGRVVERRLRPGRVRRLVARLAAGREAGGRVVGPGGLLVGLKMAAHTGESGAGEAAVLVARAAVEHPVREIEREARPRGVVPVDGLPAGRPVAHLALVAQSRLVRIVAAPNPVAVEALGRRPLRDACQVTTRARSGEVTALEREERRLVECARGGSPRDRRVTLFALVAERAAMGVLGAVTRRAGAAQSGESHRRACSRRECRGLRLVAGAAGGSAVCADEEGRLQLLVRVFRHGERLGRVAPLALLAKLPEMDVLVARRAGPFPWP